MEFWSFKFFFLSLIVNRKTCLHSFGCAPFMNSKVRSPGSRVRTSKKREKKCKPHYYSRIAILCRNKITNQLRTSVSPSLPPVYHLTPLVVFAIACQSVACTRPAVYTGGPSVLTLAPVTVHVQSANTEFCATISLTGTPRVGL